MAKRVTKTDIENINALYVKHKTYAAVARETGFSASTVKKYVIPGYTLEKRELTPLPDERVREITDFILDLDQTPLSTCAALSQEEQVEIYQLWKELQV